MKCAEPSRQSLILRTMTHVKTLLIGGTGTVSYTACFGAVFLNVHPGVVQKMREENYRVFTPDIDATYELLKSDYYKLNELVCTTNVIKEILQGAQLDVIGQLADTGKPTIIVVTRGGQIDSSPLKNKPDISAILWAGYPGQDGGSAIADILTGRAAPIGRLPQTQYPASYMNEVPMTNMAPRPGKNSSGRTNMWYNSTAVYEFGRGLHYVSFSANITSGL